MQVDLQTPQAKAALEIMLDLVKLIDKKQLDYGPGNISAFGELGLLVRCNDKIERMKNLHSKGLSPKNESMDDSWRDLANYAVIALIVRAGKW